MRVRTVKEETGRRDEKIIARRRVRQTQEALAIARKAGRRSELVTSYFEALEHGKRPERSEQLRAKINELIADSQPSKVKRCPVEKSRVNTERAVTEVKELSPPPSPKKVRYEVEPVANSVSAPDAGEMWPMAFAKVVKTLVPQTVFTVECRRFRIPLTMEDRARMLRSRRPDGTFSCNAYLRFCERTGNGQDVDFFPVGLTVKINNVDVPFDKQRVLRVPKTYSCPLPINNLIALDRDAEDELEVWLNKDDPGFDLVWWKVFAFGIYLCESEASIDVLARATKNAKIPREDTIGLIRDYLNPDGDDGLMVDNLVKVPVNCPIQMTRMNLPCRGVNCPHFSCFDLSNFINLYAIGEGHRMRCPHCMRLLRVEDLRIDLFTLHLVMGFNKIIDPELEIKVDEDGKVKCVTRRDNNL